MGHLSPEDVREEKELNENFQSINSVWPSEKGVGENEGKKAPPTEPTEPEGGVKNGGPSSK